MPLSFRRSLPITGAAVVMTGALAVAQTHATPAPRVRPESTQTIALLNDLLARSRTARALVDALNRSDVIAYVRHRTFTTTTLDGRTGFVRSAAPTRMLIIELSCQRSWLEQMVTLGHELQHATEIAADRTVVDPASMVRYFDRIGVRTSVRGELSFETAQARDVAARVRQELVGNCGTARTVTHERH